MNFLQSLLFSLRKLLFFRSSASELIAELQFHIDMSIDKKMAEGMSREQAERDARKEFGSDLRIREDCRESWGTRLVDETVQDVRRAVRSLRRHPAYSVPVVLILAISLGVFGTFADILYQRILRPLPYPNADAIIEIARNHLMERYQDAYMPPTYTAFESLLEMEGAFNSIGQMMADGRFLDIDNQTEYLYVGLMTTGMWDVMQVLPQYGRAFSQYDVNEGNEKVAVVTYAFARQRFGNAETALGDSLLLSGQYYQIIGVLGKGDRFPAACDIYLPLSKSIDFRHGSSSEARGPILCRLNPGVTQEQLMARLPAVMEIIKEREERNRYFYESSGIHFKVRKFVDSFKVSYSKLSFPQLVWLLSILAFFLFLIACLNWISVFCTNLIRDMRNTGVCYALGAPKNRMFRSLWIGNFILNACALLLGIGLSAVFHDVVNHTSLFERNPLLNSGFGIRVMVMLVCLSSLMSVPFICHHLWNKKVQQYLHDRQTTTSVKSKSLFALSLVQISLGAILVLISMLLTLNIQRILKTDFGFEYENRIVASISIPDWKGKLSDDAKLHLLKQLKERILKNPHLESVSLSTDLPQANLMGKSSSLKFSAETFPSLQSNEMLEEDGQVLFRTNIVDSDFQHALGLHLLAGRWFEPTDALSGELEVVIEESAAKALFGDGSPIGFNWARKNNKGKIIDQYRIIGVVNDVSYDGNQFKRNFLGYRAYLFYAESHKNVSWPKDYCITCKSKNLDVSDFENLRKAIREVDSDLAVKMKSNVEAIRERYGSMVLMSRVSLVLSVMTALIAGYGFFSFLYYKTQLMKKEFAIRLALGARQWQLLLKYMVSQSISIGVGTGVGMAAVFWLMGDLGHHLTEVSRSEVAPYLAVSAGMLGLVLLSSLFPWFQMRKLELREILQGE